MTSLLSQYYQGITQQLRANVDFIHALFEHQGLKGEGNEKVLAELVTRFLPSEYSVGSGVLVDSAGASSRQCDIVVYDRRRYPNILGLGVVSLFPVDLVYATIEIKTTLNAAEARKAIDNIRSVRSLRFVPQDTIRLRGNAVVRMKTTPPLGFVFSYNTDAEKFETFKNWFIPGEGEDPLHFPSVACSLDQGFVKFETPTPTAGTCPRGFAAILCNDEGTPTQITACGNTADIAHIPYPVKSVQGGRYAVDESKSLLYFLILLAEFLSGKELIHSTSFLRDYFQGSLGMTLEV